MKYLQTIQSQMSLFLKFYLETLIEAFNDINDYLDNLLESKLAEKIVIVGIIITPFLGTFIFLTVLSISF